MIYNHYWWIYNQTISQFRLYLWNNDSISASIDNKDNESKKAKFATLFAFMSSASGELHLCFCFLYKHFITLDLLSCTSELLFLNILKLAFKFIKTEFLFRIVKSLKLEVLCFESVMFSAKGRQSQGQVHSCSRQW